MNTVEIQTYLHSNAAEQPETLRGQNLRDLLDLAADTMFAQELDGDRLRAALARLVAEAGYSSGEAEPALHDLTASKAAFDQARAALRLGKGVA